MSNANNLLTVPDIANRLKVTPQYVRKLISGRKIPALRIGSQWVVSTEDLDAYINTYNICIEPDDHKRLSDELPEIIALSFFSGAMGLDIGMSNMGIHALLACESNKYCRMTIAQNAPEMALIGDINKYEPKDILRFAKIPDGRKVDVIFGGPPCQAFSTAGARRTLYDERGNVFLRYIDVVASIRPTYVVIENVRGLLSAPYFYGGIEEPIKGGALCVIIDMLHEAGYTLSFELYNSANFGTPQIRERIVMIGKLGNEKVPYLSPTHSEDGSFNLPRWRTLREALEGSESIEHHYIEFPEKRLKYYRMLTEGQYWRNLPSDMQFEAMGAKLKLSGGKTGFLRRLNFNRPSPTLVTNPAMPATDLCHPKLDRPLSIEEYRLIQEFPVNWWIYGPILEQYRQIGNAVPIKLGEAIARTILADMRGEILPTFNGFVHSRYKNTNDITWQTNINDVLKKAKKNQAQREHIQMTLFENFAQ